MKSSLPDLNRLAVFYRVFQLGSFQSAAKSLGVTRSAVSQSIIHLEEELGASLFARNGRSLIPTRSARTIHATLEPVMHALTERLDSGSFDGGQRQMTGSIRFSSPMAILLDFLIPAIQVYSKSHPRVNFEIMHSGGEAMRILKLTDQGVLDFWVVDSALLYGDLGQIEKVDLFEEREILTASASLFRSHFKERPDLRKILSAPHVSYHPNGADIRAWVDQTFGEKIPQSGFPRPVLHVDSVHAIHQAIREGIGVGLLPESMIAQELKQGRLVAILPTRSRFINSISLIRPREKKLSPPAQAFWDLIVQLRS